MPRHRRKTTLSRQASTPSLAKVATGIDGFDEITGGGLPQGRPTLVCGGPGCGKTLFGLAVPRSTAPRTASRACS